MIDATAQTGYTSARSGTIGAESETWLETTVEGAGTLTFRWRVDCEKDDGGGATWDRLAVFTNGVEAARIDGKTGWQTVELPVSSTTTIRWSFYRDDFDEPETVDLLVSNPPYIPTAECATLDPRIRDFEPMNALDGGPQGLDFYERLVGDALNVLRPGGGVFFEIGDCQGEALRKLFFDAGFDSISIEKDYAGHDRYASAVRPVDQ